MSGGNHISSGAGEHEWSPAPDSPQSPEFYRRVLHYMPSPLFVVNEAGEVVYANQALLNLGGWSLDDHNLNVLEHVHPDDQAIVAEAFGEIIESPGARVLGNGQAWAEIHFRIVAADGTDVPVKVVGRGGLTDPAVSGLIYEVRPDHRGSLISQVLDGLSNGASMHHLLSLIARIIATPPLDLDAVILQSTQTDHWIVAGSTSQVLTEVCGGDSVGLPWHAASKEPVVVPVDALPPRIGAQLRAAGYQDLWHVSIDSPLTANTLRIIAASPTHHVPSTGPNSRLRRIRELAAAVLLRSEADVLLDYASGHDHLTDLPNRAAFFQQAERTDPLTTRAAIHLDLDGLQTLNRELGQASGDAVLQIVADRLRSSCDPGDALSRLGDDEFAVLVTAELDPLALMDQVLSVADRVLRSIEEPVIVGGQSVRISASIGVATVGGGVSTDLLLNWANAAMHDAKAAGGGRICKYSLAFS